MFYLVQCQDYHDMLFSCRWLSGVETHITSESALRLRSGNALS